MTDLSQAIESVKINARFPQLLDEEKFESMRNAALYLTAAIMDCLALLIKGATQSGTYSLGWTKSGSRRKAF